jgi:hypothetical protein
LSLRLLCVFRLARCTRIPSSHGQGASERLLWPTFVPHAASRFPGDFLDESFHGHAFCDKACSGLIHRLEQAPPCLIDPSKLPHIDFDRPSRDRRGTPRILGFRNPGACEPS